jgi:hypothetical protein
MVSRVVSQVVGTILVTIAFALFALAALAHAPEQASVGTHLLRHAILLVAFGAFAAVIVLIAQSAEDLVADRKARAATPPAAPRVTPPARMRPPAAAPASRRTRPTVAVRPAPPNNPERAAAVAAAAKLSGREREDAMRRVDELHPPAVQSRGLTR